MLQDDEFYMEDGKFVLTERYHFRRGHCCGNACRHCPFKHKSVPARIRLKKQKPRPYFGEEFREPEDLL